MIRNFEIENEIKNSYTCKNAYQIRWIFNAVISNPRFEEYLKDILKNEPEWINLKNVLKSIFFDIKLNACKKCGKLIAFNHLRNAYCSKTCMNSDESFKKIRAEKSKKTIFEKYGVENAFQLQEIKDKIKNSMISKYGVDSPMKSSEIKIKFKENYLKNHGVDNPWKDINVKEKIKTTMLCKYGVEHALQNDLLKNTAVKHMKEHIHSDKDKAEQLKKSKITNNHKSFLNLNRFSDYVIPMFDENEWEGLNSKKEYKWKCVKCGNEFSQKIYNTSFMKNISQILPRCLKCYPMINSGRSNEELELADFCKEYFKNLLSNDRKTIGIEIDILIPEIKLGIEFNGIKWHNIEVKKKGYHLMKTEICNEKGYRLIHIWEDEWRKHKNEIKNRLEHIFLGTENLSFSENEIILDRSWFNNIDVKGYHVKEIIPPSVIYRNEYDVENCGYLKLVKNI